MRILLRWIVVLLVGASVGTQARPVASHRLNRVVQSLVRAVAVRAGSGLNKVTLPSIERVDVILRTDGSDPLAQIVHLRPAGFLVVASDDRIGPVIAYSFQESWNSDTSAANTLLQFIRKDLSDRLAKMDATSAHELRRSRVLWENGYGGASGYTSSDFLQWPTPGTTASGGWVETAWDQISPFNMLCPLDPVTHRRSIVGCVATAFAQLVNYHQYLGPLSFDSSDIYSSGNISVDADSTRLKFPSLRQLNEYVSRIQESYRVGAPLSDTLKAALSLACGVLVQMEYSSSASGSSDNRVLAAFRSKLKWSRAEISYVPEESYASMIANCMTGFPSLLTVYGSTGHMLIVDGYNTEGFFHVNFGWGLYNPSTVWYSLPSGIPGWCETSVMYDLIPIEVQQRYLKSSLSRVYFDPTPPSTPSAAVPITITNATPASIPVSGVQVIGGFQIGLDSLEFSDAFMPPPIAGMGKMTFYVRCRPDAIGRTEGAVLILAGQHSCAVSLSGVGGDSKGTLVTSWSAAGVWDQQHSPYYIFHDVNNTSGTLRITAGTEICFMGPYQLMIQADARIVVRGTRESPVVFHASDSTRGWQHLFINNRKTPDTLQWCIFRHGNMVDNADFYSGGGAIYARKAEVAIEDCSIESCRAYGGGGLYANASRITIRNSVIQSNWAEEQGGGIEISGGDLTIVNSIISHNSAKSVAAGLSIAHDMWGGAAASARIINSVIADNAGRLVDPNVGPAAELRIENSRVEMHNSIIWNSDQAVHPAILLIDTAYVQVRYSNVDTSSPGWLRWFSYRATCDRDQLTWHPGSISANPMFQAPLNGDYTLQALSPCIDAGDPDSQFSDQADSSHPGLALWPALGTLRNDMGACGGRRETSEMTTTLPREEALPHRYTLYNNFPNPFNPSTTIRFSIPERRNVRLMVFNQLGQEVSDLANGVREAGVHEVTFNGSQLASGVYYFRLIAGDFVQTKKLVLIK
jgi:hypothetical protein